MSHVPRWMAAFAVMLALGAFLLLKLPGSFVPDEDQGYMLVDVQLPAGATLPRTREVMQRISAILTANPAVANVFIIVGSSFTGNGENAGRAFVHLQALGRAQAEGRRSCIRWANRRFAREIHDARAYVINLPTIRGLGVFGGFDFYLEDRAGLGREALTGAQATVLDKAAHNRDPDRRARQPAAALAAAEPDRRSRTGAVDGAVGERCLHRAAADAGAGVRQRLHLPGTRAARAAAGGRPPIA